jgi:Protein of unknown function (DUF2778)
MSLSFDCRRLPRQFFTQTLPLAGALVLSLMAGVWIVTLLFTASAQKTAANTHGRPSLGPGPSFVLKPGSLAQNLSIGANVEPVAPTPPAPIAEPRKAAPAPAQAASNPAESAPLPPPRPIELGSAGAPSPGGSRLGPGYSARDGVANPRSDAAGLSTRYDRWTAVYDLTAHTVYLPGGAKLEAHSGLGDRLDDPQHVDEIDRGATPPHLYDLTLREAPFHGVQALRLNPVGGGIFGRVGLLAHSYMLGPNGDSNGCVSFKDYDAFLQAYQSGQVKRLAVVASLK